jgi:hypothetical protein
MNGAERTTEGTLSWNIREIAAALKISEADVQEYFRDGRRISFLLERRLCYEIIVGRLAPSEGAGYDLIDPGGNKWEVRSISKGGVHFCPSYMVGSGRHFDEPGFITKLQDIAGYILYDIEQFLTVPFWIVEKGQVLAWWNAGQLSSTTKVSRDQILSLLERR